MNQETQKQFGIKLLIVSAAACIGWKYLVNPLQEKVHQRQQQIAAHTALIQAHDTQVQEADAGKSTEIEEKLRSIYQQISLSNSERESGTDLHGRLHKSAAEFGISISRIETINAREMQEKLQNTDTSVTAMNNTVRVELEGDYGSILGFMDDLVSTNIPIQFTSFRMMPIGDETVRMNAEVDSVVLTSVPTETRDGDETDE